jgi:hypothetical protein
VRHTLAALAALGLLFGLLGAPAADAAWASTGSGTAAARAGHLAQITDLHLSYAGCEDVEASWTPVGEADYLVQWSKHEDLHDAHETTVSSTTVRLPAAQRVYVRVQARLGDDWHGEFSAAASAHCD